ncbi:MAG: prolyl oligopeptidase family serine peptidase [Chloroflexi bacterium]|nr:prolyl oligopeptidase family serine peptidase [Chloroflexota bacterium]
MRETVHRRWELTLDAIAHYPRPGANVPGRLAFSPDSRLLTYLFSERADLIRDLWAMDVATGAKRILVPARTGETTEENVSPEEALRRERQRQRETGVTQYSWAKAADRLLVPSNGQLSVTSSRGEPLRSVAPSAEPAIDARLTPDGQRVVFVRRSELWIADVEGGPARQLTFDASDTISNGLAEYIAQEEMDRPSGFWVSLDGSLVAYIQVDGGDIPVYPIVHQGGDAWRVEHHRYPFAGGGNVRVRLGVVSADGGSTRWLDLGSDTDIYLARVDWCPDGRLAVQVQSRDQRRLELWRYDSDGCARTLCHAEESDSWINLHDDLRFLNDGTFVWSSERTGFRHLYLYEADGRLIRQLSDGDWPVDAVVDVDEARRRVYFLAGRESRLERHVYGVTLDGGELTRLSIEPGFHAAVLSPDGRWYAHSSESRTRPPSVALRSSEEDRVRVVNGPADPGEAAPGLRPPELVDVEARDGAQLSGAIYRPDPSHDRHRTIVAVYGGPHLQTVNDTWSMTVDLRAQFLASRGFLVFKLDNRGSARRGAAFERVIHRRMGTIEVQDQVDGVRWLAARGLAEPGHVGVYGWSYGGYLAIMCLLTAPDVFAVGVAGAPVVDWDGYDTHYTERYMDAPSANSEGYRAGSALTHVGGLAGQLLVVHGMIDENVHFRHTARLVSALQAAGRSADLLVFPNERHMPRSEVGRRHLETRVAEYFETHL